MGCALAQLFLATSLPGVLFDGGLSREAGGGQSPERSFAPRWIQTAYQTILEVSRGWRSCRQGPMCVNALVTPRERNVARLSPSTLQALRRHRTWGSRVHQAPRSPRRAPGAARKPRRSVPEGLLWRHRQWGAGAAASRASGASPEARAPQVRPPHPAAPMATEQPFLLVLEGRERSQRPSRTVVACRVHDARHPVCRVLDVLASLLEFVSRWPSSVRWTAFRPMLGCVPAPG